MSFTAREHLGLLYRLDDVHGALGAYLRDVGGQIDERLAEQVALVQRAQLVDVGSHARLQLLSNLLFVVVVVGSGSGHGSRQLAVDIHRHRHAVVDEHEVARLLLVLGLLDLVLELLHALQRVGVAGAEDEHSSVGAREQVPHLIDGVGVARAQHALGVVEAERLLDALVAVPVGHVDVLDGRYVGIVIACRRLLCAAR